MVGRILSPTVVVALYLSSFQDLLGPNAVPSPAVAPAVTEASQSISLLFLLPDLAVPALPGHAGVAHLGSMLSSRYDAYQISSHSLAALSRGMGLWVNQNTSD